MRDSEGLVPTAVPPVGGVMDDNPVVTPIDGPVDGFPSQEICVRTAKSRLNTCADRAASKRNTCDAICFTALAGGILVCFATANPIGYAICVGIMWSIHIACLAHYTANYNWDMNSCQTIYLDSMRRCGVYIAEQ